MLIEISFANYGRLWQAFAIFQESLNYIQKQVSNSVLKFLICTVWDVKIVFWLNELEEWFLQHPINAWLQANENFSVFYQIQF